jgi:hypothetical protein
MSSFNPMLLEMVLSPEKPMGCLHIPLPSESLHGHFISPSLTSVPVVENHHFPLKFMGATVKAILISSLFWSDIVCFESPLFQVRQTSRLSPNAIPSREHSGSPPFSCLAPFYQISTQRLALSAPLPSSHDPTTNPLVSPHSIHQLFFFSTSFRIQSFFLFQHREIRPAGRNAVQNPPFF